MATSLTLAAFICVSSVLCILSASASSPACSRSDFAFLDEYTGDSGPRCPLSIELSPPVELSGEALDSELSHRQKDDYYSIFFYASWCPFSRRTRPVFDALSSMFPQIRHLAVEESSALPSVFSRYGIHSFPSILFVNQTRRIHYHGPKDLTSLALFYEKVSGLEPVVYLSGDHLKIMERETSPKLWIASPREIMAREPYLALATLFICFRAIFYFFSGIFLKFKAFWLSYIQHVNLGIFGGSNQLVGRALHVIDMKKLWSKLRLCNKSRNFQKGANNARAWASSLTSVSLGESSCSRSGSSDS